MCKSIPTVDGAEIQRRLHELAQISVLPDRLWRPSYTPQEGQARRLLTSWFAQAGLSTRLDAAGNLLGRAGGAGQVTLIGSHMDTVKGAGAYDGTAGVLCGLAALQTLLAHFGPPRAPVELVAMVEEEGSRFPDASFWGSRSILGQADPALLSCRDEAEVTLAQAMADAGFDPARLPDARRTDLARYFEVHIEQGPVLEHRGIQLGVVDTITGLGTLAVEITGRANHAGTTPMDLRLDALQGAAGLVLRLPGLARRFQNATATAGSFQVFPGSANVIPGRVSILVDYRAPDPDDLARLGREIDQAAHSLEAEGYGVTTQLRMSLPPARLDRGLGALLEQCADELSCSSMHMISGAGHDCQLFAGQVPSALLFLPCRDGRSHCPEEYAAPEDLARGAQVLAAALYRLAWQET